MIGYIYDDYGQTEASGEIGFYNEICYTGGIYDKSTGLYYLNARYYNPEDGRFITQDTERGDKKDPTSLVLYQYCASNPINYMDPSGHWRIPKWLKKVGKYLKKSANQVVSGRYTNDSTILGTLGQFLLGVTDFDLPCDIRDIQYDLTSKNSSYTDTLLEGLAVLPIIGVAKYVKYGDKAEALVRGANHSFKLPKIVKSAKGVEGTFSVKGYKYRIDTNKVAPGEGGFHIHIYRDGKEVAKLNGKGGWVSSHGVNTLLKPSQINKTVRSEINKLVKHTRKKLN